MSSSLTATSDLTGLRVASFESRKAKDIARLIEKNGGTALCAPSMRELPLSDESGAIAFGKQLLNGECDALVLLTGVGTRILLDTLYAHYARADVLARLGEIKLLCRGPKPAALLKREGLTATLVAAEPNTWRELLGAIDTGCPVENLKVCVQEYGAPNPSLLEGLISRGAIVSQVPVYRWALPADTKPLEQVLRQLIAGEVECALFTSAHQVENVLKFADSLGLAGQVKTCLQSQMVVASVGPVTSESLLRHEIHPDIVPQHPKMGPLVVTLARQARAALARYLPQPGD